MMLSWTFEPDSPAEENMRRDHELMRAEAPCLRLYTWHPPAISLGGSQKPDLLNLEACAELGIAVVHRFTGGAAVLHKDDLTYAFFWPAGAAPKLRAMEVRERFSDAFLATFRQFGVTAEESRNAKWRMPESAICFHGHAAHEILIQGKKVAGNAQRLTRDGIFQHGSILLENTEPLFCRLVREAQEQGAMTGLREHCPGLHERDLALRLAAEVARAFGCDLATATA